MLCTTVPTLPAAETPVSAICRASTLTVPTLPVADTPDKSTAITSATLPAFPVAATPVRATTTLFSPRAAYGDWAYADIPNMVYGLRRLRLGCSQTQQCCGCGACRHCQSESASRDGL